MWQNLCANTNYYKICFKYISVFCYMFVREWSGSPDLVEDSRQVFSSKRIPFQNNALHMFKVGSIKIKVKFNSTVLNPPSF